MANLGPAVINTVNTQSSYGNIQAVEVISVTLSPSSVATATSAEQTFSGKTTGILAGDVIVGVAKPTAQAGLGIVGWRNDSSVSDKFYITFMNATAATITPTASEVYLVSVARQNSAATGITTFA